jgi:hypothetical protein
MRDASDVVDAHHKPKLCESGVLWNTTLERPMALVSLFRAVSVCVPVYWYENYYQVQIQFKGQQTYQDRE